MRISTATSSEADTSLLSVVGIAQVILGLSWPGLSKRPFGRLLGDIHIERVDFSFDFPLTTSILLSLPERLIL